MKKSIFLVLAFLVFSCHQPTKKYTQEEAEAQVLALPMVQEASKHIDKITVGYNSDVRFETYHIFYVNKENKEDVRISDPVSGEIIPVSEYKK